MQKLANWNNHKIIHQQGWNSSKFLTVAIAYANISQLTVRVAKSQKEGKRHFIFISRRKNLIWGSYSGINVLNLWRVHLAGNLEEEYEQRIDKKKTQRVMRV